MFWLLQTETGSFWELTDEYAKDYGSTNLYIRFSNYTFQLTFTAAQSLSWGVASDLLF